MTGSAIKTVIFDFGGVIFDWDPRHLYRKVFETEAEVERFLAEVCTSDWHVAQDGGRPTAEAVAELSAKFPEHGAEIGIFYERAFEMISGPIEGTVALLRALHAKGVPLYALSNWPRETFPPVRERYDFMDLFSGIAISGEEGMLKPDTAFFRILLERYGIAPEEAVFIDDKAYNVAAAESLGIAVVHFTSPEALEARLRHDGLL